jgi:hypothetical protein
MWRGPIHDVRTTTMIKTTRPLPVVRLVALLVGLFAALLSTQHASAQGSPTRLGFKGGMNLSQFYGTEIGQSESLESIVFGIFGEFGIGGRLSVQPEINYSKRGAREDDLLEAATGGVWHYNYFDVVPLLKLRLTSMTSPLSVSLFAGPVLSILGSSKATGTKPEEFGAECAGCDRELIAFPYVRLLQANTKGKDIGGTVGMSVAIPAGPADVVFDLRYAKMMNEFDEAPYDELYSRKHSLLAFQVGVSIGEAAWGGGRTRRAAPIDDPDRHSIVTLDVMERQAIVARDETLSVHDIIRAEHPDWVDGEEVDGTLFVDGARWEGPALILHVRRGFEVEEVLRMENAPGAYEGSGVVVEVITRGGVWR